MLWTGRADEAAALGLLLDRTYAGLAAAAAHPRDLDREFLVGQFCLWVDHLRPAVAAGAAPPWARRSAARAVWRRLGLSAGPGQRRWMADHLDGLGLDPTELLGPARVAGEDGRDTTPELPSRGMNVAAPLGQLQHGAMLRLRMMRYDRLLRRWELAAAAELLGGLNAELFRVRPAALRARWAARRMEAILATEDGLQRAFLREATRDMELDVPGATDPPTPVRITVRTAERLLGEIDFTGSRLRFVRTGADEAVIHLDVRRGGRETIVVIVLTEPLDVAPLTVSPGGLILTRPPTLEATADDVTLTIPLPGGDWTPRAAAGSWYVD